MGDGKESLEPCHKALSRPGIRPTLLSCVRMVWSSWRKLAGTKLARRPILQMTPDQLHRIEVRRVGGQPLQVQSRVTCAEGAHERPFVVAASVPDDDDLPAQMPQQRAQKLHHCLRRDVVFRVGPARRGPIGAGRGARLKAAITETLSRCSAEGRQHRESGPWVPTCGAPAG